MPAPQQGQGQTVTSNTQGKPLEIDEHGADILGLPMDIPKPTESEIDFTECPTATAWLESISSEPSLLRGVLPLAMLEDFGFVIRSGPVTNFEEGERCFAKSVVVGRLDSFLSHSWHANAKVKALALHCYFNGTAASCAGAVALFVTILLIATRRLPHWSDNVPGHAYREFFLAARFPHLVSGFPNRISDSCWAGISFLCVYLCTLLLWQRALFFLGCAGKCAHRDFMQSRLFLDKLCIHQTNLSQKRKGIDAIGAYLIRARQLLILWDETYFSRLWCIFEVAVFSTCARKDKTSRKMHFYPSSMLAVEVIVCISVTCLWIICKLLSVTGASGLIPENLPALIWLNLYIPPFLCLVALAWILRKLMRDVRTSVRALTNFSIHDTKCGSENDRKFVYDSILDFYGTLEAFEEYVRCTFSSEVTKSSRVNVFGEFETFGYWTFVRSIGLPSLAYYGGIDQAYIESADPADSSQYILFNCIAWLVLFPLVTTYSSWSLDMHLDVKTKWQELLMCMCCALALLCGQVLGHFALVAFLAEEIVPKVVFASFTAVLAVIHCVNSYRHLSLRSR